MGRIRMDTIGDAMRHGYLLKVACRSCSNVSYHDPRALLVTYRKYMRIDDLRFDCTKCGRKNYDVQIASIDTLPDEEFIIWHPVRSKRKIKV